MFGLRDWVQEDWVQDAGRLDPRDLKTALFCISFLRKGEVLAYGGRIHNLKDLKDHRKTLAPVVAGFI